MYGRVENTDRQAPWTNPRPRLLHGLAYGLLHGLPYGQLYMDYPITLRVKNTHMYMLTYLRMCSRLPFGAILLPPFFRAHSFLVL